MNASAGLLVERAISLYEEYGWISAGVIQRRLRVTRRLSEYLMRELEDQQILSPP